MDGRIEHVKLLHYIKKYDPEKFYVYTIEVNGTHEQAVDEKLSSTDSYRYRLRERGRRSVRHCTGLTKNFWNSIQSSA